MELEKRFALLVEDDIDLAQIFTGALQSANYETETFLDGGEAHQFLKTRIPQIIVLDLHLPSISGIDLLKYVRAEKRLANSQVVVITGDRLAADEVRETADFVFVKPISFSQLRDLTARLQL